MTKINITQEDRHVDTSPERRLIIAILQTVFDDLDHENERHRFDAYEFLLSKRGPSADSRRHLLSLLGLDDDAVQLHLAHLRDSAPEHPNRSLRRSRTEGSESDRWIIAAWPKNRPTSMTEMAKILNMHPHTTTQRLTGMVHRGDLVRISRGRFVPAEWVDDEAA